jgi:uncharacterized protein DUF6448
MPLRVSLVVVMLVAFALAPTHEARAHCDTLNGPVVSAARIALRTNDVTPVLKWVRESEEPEVRRAFQKTIAVRSLNAAAEELADRFFFETLVRLHRLGEGEPYTGLQATADLDESVEGADHALRTGNVEPLERMVSERVAKGVRARFARARDLQRHADDSVAAGRRYVAAYVDFIHFVDAAARDTVVDAEGRH